MSPVVGRPAPDFTLRDQHGQSVTLASYRGDKAVVAMFYPFAFSSGCTNELRQLRDALPHFQNEDVQLLAISCDPMYSLRAFAEYERLDFPLLSDFWPHGAVARAYGVFDDLRGRAGRGSFVIDHNGLLRWSVFNADGNARGIDDYRTALAAF